MKPAAFKYHDPRTLSELAGLLASLENTKLLAGGQSLGPMLNFRLVAPDHLIDLNKIPDLVFVRAGNGTLDIGAMTRQRALERSSEIERACPLLNDALRFVGHFQTRNRGTLGGSLCHLDPAAELPGLCALYDAELTVMGPNGERTVPMPKWGVSFMTPDVGIDEVLIRIRLNLWTQPHGRAFLEFARRHGDFAIAGVACLLALDDAGKVSRAAISLVGVSNAPIRLSVAEQVLVGSNVDEAAIKAAAAEVAKIEAIDDAHVSAAYRKRIAGVLLGRALKQAHAGAKP
ncbi:MAG: FAD binding domain-containing protein [Burkholderiales bacterium]